MKRLKNAFLMYFQCVFNCPKTAKTVDIMECLEMDLKLATDFPEKSAAVFSETRAGGGGGRGCQRPFGSSPKIHPKWNREAFLKLTAQEIMIMNAVLDINR